MKMAKNYQVKQHKSAIKKVKQSKEKAGQQEILNQKIRTVPLKAGQLELV